MAIDIRKKRPSKMSSFSMFAILIALSAILAASYKYHCHNIRNYDENFDHFGDEHESNIMGKDHEIIRINDINDGDLLVKVQITRKRQKNPINSLFDKFKRSFSTSNMESNHKESFKFQENPNKISSNVNSFEGNKQPILNGVKRILRGVIQTIKKTSRSLTYAIDGILTDMIRLLVVLLIPQRQRRLLEIPF
jgi:hypothetical protein